jgi:hypothetical protein
MLSVLTEVADVGLADRSDSIAAFGSTTHS